MQEATTGTLRAKRWFLGGWALLLATKLALATSLPLFVDEAFYWQESMHPGWAYSDLPALTAWLAHLGIAIGGQNLLAMRMPSLLLAACVPWLVARIAARESSALHGWQAGTLALLLPLAGTLGLLALPDVALALAGLLCLDAGSQMLRRVTAFASVELALGLVIGGLSHYRFIAVIGVGMLVLLAIPQGRQALRDWRAWLAIGCGALAWLPLLLWNQHNAEAGLRFQLIDRHPWVFHVDGIMFVLIQAALVTPLLFAAMSALAWRFRRARDPGVRYLAWTGAWLVLGFFVLGFFADNERVSFHWPLPGYLALLPLVPGELQRWNRRWRQATYALLACGLLATLGYYAVACVPGWRAALAGSKAYPSNLAGWTPLADAVRAQRASMPAGTRIVADNFKLGAEIGFALGEPDIAVLPHPLNRKHGREPQLALWGLLAADRAALGMQPVLLAVGATEVSFSDLLAHYHALCARLGPLPPPRTLNVDHGAQRFLLFELPAQAATGACTTPAMAWVDVPAVGAQVGREFEVAGWAFKDGVGLSGVEVTLDGKLVARATYGIEMPNVAAYWKISTDPQQPRVGFRAHVDARAFPPGRHWLGLRLHGLDGSIETWSEQPIHLAP